MTLDFTCHFRYIYRQKHCRMFYCYHIENLFSVLKMSHFLCNQGLHVMLSYLNIFFILDRVLILELTSHNKLTFFILEYFTYYNHIWDLFSVPKMSHFPRNQGLHRILSYLNTFFILDRVPILELTFHNKLTFSILDVDKLLSY